MAAITEGLSLHRDFIVCELIWFWSNLADVVEEGSHRQRFLLSDGQIDAVGQERCVETDSAAVVEQLPVLCLEQVGEQRQEIRPFFSAGGRIRLTFSDPLVSSENVLPCLRAFCFGPPETGRCADKTSKKI